MLEKYDEIRPYTDQEAVEAIQRLFRDAEFVRSLSYFEDQLDIDQLVRDALDCKSIIEFQKRFSAKILYYFINKSTTGLHFSGIENVDPHQPHLYIANHRDIVLDSSLLQTYLFQNNFPSTKSAIGDNLISGPLFVELARINNMMLVLRSSNIHNRIANVKLLSDYIQHSIVEDKESVWLAQRSGRTKNGYDQTQQGLIKMVSMAERKNPIPHLKSLNIIPVTISYEYESCDQLKAREWALSEEGKYIKEPGEDFKSIVQGVTQFKGEVHMQIGKPIADQLDQIDLSMNINDQLTEVCQIIDQQIHENFYLHKNNYIAYDYMEQQGRFQDLYSLEEKNHFMDYLEKQAHIEEVSYEKMFKNLLLIYSNPVRAKLGETIPCNIKEEE